jgi:hypothetical protein
MTKEMLIANAGLKVAAPRWVDLQFELICAARDTMAAGDTEKALSMLHFAATVVAHPDFFGDEMIEQLYNGLRAQA